MRYSRRQFLVSSAASTAVPFRQTAASGEAVALFGINWPVESDGILVTTGIPNVQVSWPIGLPAPWHLDRASGLLTIPWSQVEYGSWGILRVQLSLKVLRILEGGKTLWKVSGVTFDLPPKVLVDLTGGTVQGSGPNDLVFQCSAFELTSPAFTTSLGAYNDDLFIAFNDVPLIASVELPLSISAGDPSRLGLSAPSGAFQIDLLSGYVNLLPGFLTARIGVKTEIGGHVDLAFEGSGQSGLRSLDLTRDIASIAFEFSSNDVFFIPIGGEIVGADLPVSWANPVGLPIKIDGANLLVTVESGDPGSKITALAAKPAVDHLRVWSYGLNSPDLKPLILDTTGSDILALKIRPLRRGFPGTFLLADSTSMSVVSRAPLEIHGAVDGGYNTIGTAGVLTCDILAPSPNPPTSQPVVDALLADATFPYLRLADVAPLQHARPGELYVQVFPSDATVESWSFSGGRPALPLSPLSFLDRWDIITEQFKQELSLLSAGYRAPVGAPVTHKSNLVETPLDSSQSVGLLRLYAAAPPPILLESPGAASSDTSIAVSGYTVVRDYGLVAFQCVVNPGQNPSYQTDYLIVYSFDTDAARYSQIPAEFALDPSRSDFQAVWPSATASAPTGGLPLAILKFSDRYSLADIFAQESISDVTPGIYGPLHLLTDVIDEDVQAATWTGLFLPNTALDLSGFPLLGNIVASDPTFKLSYLALSPHRPGASTGPGNTAVWARILWGNPNSAQSPPNPLPQDEATFCLNWVDAAWKNSSLLSFNADATATFKSAFGQKLNAPVILDITGFLDSVTQEIRFVAHLGDKIPILASAIGPLKQVFIEQAQMIQSGTNTRVDVSGDVQLQALTWGPIDLNVYSTVPSISFSGLGLIFPTAGSQPQNGFVSYPSIQFDLSLPHFHFFSQDWFQVELSAVGIDWSGTIDWGALRLLAGAPLSNLQTVYIDIRLSLGKLPMLAEASVSDLAFTLRIGFPRDANAGVLSSAFSVYLDAYGFRNLQLDLMRFLTLSIGSADLIRKNYLGADVPWFEFSDVTVTVLGTDIIKNASAYLYTTPTQEAGFVLGTGQVALGSLLTFYGSLIGRNVKISSTYAEQIIGLSIDETQLQTAWSAIKTAVDDLDIIPANLQATDSHIGNWVFGAGFSFLSNNFVVGKFLFQDNAYCGLALYGNLFQSWFNYPFAISGLYIKGATPAEDHILVSANVPAVDVGVYRFTGGVISVDVALNGSFKLDVGFPWPDGNGGRQWNRTLGAIITPLQGSGGFYISYQKTSASAVAAGELLIGGGYAVQAGVGASFDAGIFAVWVRAGFYAILEGQVQLQISSCTIDGLQISGAVGVLVEGYGELNWWIICVRVGVMASAEAQATLTWGALSQETGKAQWALPAPNIAPLAKGLQSVRRRQHFAHRAQLARRTHASAGPVQISMQFSLEAEAYAQACIGAGPFQVCKSISASVNMSFGTTLTL